MNKRLLNVTDLSSYLYCPRKFFLEKIKGLRQPPTKPMIEGKIRHEVLEEFSNKEQEFIESLNVFEVKEIENKFNELLRGLAGDVFSRNFGLIEKFEISRSELHNKILEAMKQDIRLRAESISATIKKGFIGKPLWDHLEPKYISEMPLMSESLGLKGRADRVMISGEKIIPFELKTRAVEKVWPSDEIQLTSYAMLLEEKYNKNIPMGILESGNKKHEIIISEELKQKVNDLIKEINELMDSTNPRYPDNFSKCQKCSWEEECDNL